VAQDCCAVCIPGYLEEISARSHVSRVAHDKGLSDVVPAASPGVPKLAAGALSILTREQHQVY